MVVMKVLEWILGVECLMVWDSVLFWFVGRRYGDFVVRVLMCLMIL